MHSSSLFCRLPSEIVDSSVLCWSSQPLPKVSQEGIRQGDPKSFPHLSSLYPTFWWIEAMKILFLGENCGSEAPGIPHGQWRWDCGENLARTCESEVDLGENYNDWIVFQGVKWDERETALLFNILMVNRGSQSKLYIFHSSPKSIPSSCSMWEGAKVERDRVKEQSGRERDSVAIIKSI